MVRVDTQGIPYPVFVYAALVPWTYFSTAMTDSSQSLVTNARMLTKIYFPRLIFPLTPVLAKLVDFVIAFGLLLVMMLWFRISPTWEVVFLPLLILLMVVTAAGTGKKSGGRSRPTCLWQVPTSAVTRCPAGNSSWIRRS